jgi:hypothetical protein
MAEKKKVASREAPKASGPKTKLKEHGLEPVGAETRVAFNREETARALRDATRQFREDFTSAGNLLELRARSLESVVPKDSTHPDARQVHRFIALARAELAKGDTFDAAILAGVWIADATAYWKDLMLWEDAIRGERFSGNGRGLNLLYRKAVEILQRLGRDTPAGRVLNELAAGGVICFENEGLRWTDDKGRRKLTKMNQFEKNLSLKRSLVR